jgi:hypothetical protein
MRLLASGCCIDDGAMFLGRRESGGRRRPCRQHDLEPRPAILAGGCRQFAAVLVDNHLADGEAEARSLCLGGDEGIEDRRQVVRIDAGAGVVQGDGNRSGAVARGGDGDDARRGSIGHCVDRVLDQVEQDFPKLSGMALDERKARRELRDSGYAPLVQIPLQQAGRFEHQRVYVRGLQVPLAVLGQPEKVVEHFVGAGGGALYLSKQLVA